jgi:hypothetical protein
MIDEAHNTKACASCYDVVLFANSLRHQIARVVRLPQPEAEIHAAYRLNSDPVQVYRLFHALVFYSKHCIERGVFRFDKESLRIVKYRPIDGQDWQRRNTVYTQRNFFRPWGILVPPVRGTTTLRLDSMVSTAVIEGTFG